MPQFAKYFLNVVRIVRLDMIPAKMMFVSHQSLKDRKAHADSGQLSGFKYSGHPPLMIHQLDLVPNLESLLLGVVFVDKHVLIVCEWAALKKVESAAHLRELIEIKSGD